MINETFVKAIANLVKDPIVQDVAGVPCLFRPAGNGEWTVHDMREKDYYPDPVELATLSGLIEFVNANKDGIALNEALIQVEDEATVTFYSKTKGLHLKRAPYAAVNGRKLFEEQHSIGRWQDHEAFVIWVQSEFVDTPERSQLLRFVGNVSDENVKTSIEDGVTQVATVRSGVSAALRAEAGFTNPVKLRPYRTFREIEQPESSFIFRMKKGSSGLIMALFQADGSGWKLKALDSIREHIQAHVKDIPVIA